MAAGLLVGVGSEERLHIRVEEIPLSSGAVNRFDRFTHRHPISGDAVDHAVRIFDRDGDSPQNLAVSVGVKAGVEGVFNLL